MNQDNPFCKACQEPDCLISPEGECAILKNYKIYQEFYSSVSCLFVEGIEFHTREIIYNAIKTEWEKTTGKIVNENS